MGIGRNGNTTAGKKLHAHASAARYEAKRVFIWMNDLRFGRAIANRRLASGHAKVEATQRVATRATLAARRTIRTVREKFRGRT
jgi:hypothetical protein